MQWTARFGYLLAFLVIFLTCNYANVSGWRTKQTRPWQQKIATLSGALQLNAKVEDYEEARQAYQEEDDEYEEEEEEEEAEEELINALDELNAAAEQDEYNEADDEQDVDDEETEDVDDEAEDEGRYLYRSGFL